jgi:hypothetical protein
MAAVWLSAVSALVFEPLCMCHADMWRPDLSYAPVIALESSSSRP